MYKQILIIVSLFLILHFPGYTAEIYPSLQKKMAQASDAESISIYIQFKKAVERKNYNGRKDAGRLIRDLQNSMSQVKTQFNQDLNKINSLQANNGLIQYFWIGNCAVMQADQSAINALAKNPLIDYIELDSGGSGSNLKVQPNVVSAEWNILKVQAERAWQELGADGSGVVVGVMDTGLDTAHPALAGKWRGGSNSWKDIQNGLEDPYDDHFHGTHVTGIMMGGDGPGPFINDIGVAYNSKVVSAKVLDENNSFSNSSIVIAGAQFMLDPDGDPETNDFPHVINNSWNFFSATFSGFHSTVETWRAAGIIPVFNIGNFGPNPSTTRPPGNYNNTIGIAATTMTDAIANFSSRGVTPSGFAFPADGQKPDFSAPGELVRSSFPGGSYNLLNGTSMAAPHVAGTIALMLQKKPSLDYDEIFQIFLDTSLDLGTEGVDLNFGHGRIDTYEAVNVVCPVTSETPAQFWHLF